jgi:uncharacterized membrane-anchored protein YhcB (DUF1043 family)
MDMATAAKLVGRVSMGSTSILTRYGIVLKKGATATEALAAMQTKFGGAAEAYGDTTQGQIDKTNNALAKFQVQIGTALLPTLGKMAKMGADFLDFFQSLPEPVRDATILLGAAGAAALIAGPWITKMGGAYTFLASQATLATGAVTMSTAASAAATLGMAGLAFGAGLAAGAFLNEFVPGLKEGQQAMGESIASMKSIAQYQQEDIAKSGASADTQAMMAKMYDATTGKLTDYGRELMAHNQAQDTAIQRAKDLAFASDGSAKAKARAASAADKAAAADDGWVRAMNGAKVAADTLAGTERSLTELDVASRTANLDLSDAEDTLKKVRKDKKATSKDIERAEIAVTTAQIKATDSARDLANAQVDAGVKVDGTRGEVTDYRKELGLIPGDVTTTVNFRLNTSAVDTFITRLRNLDPRAGLPGAPKPKKHDAGGYFDQPHYGVVGEKSGEYVINPRRANAPALIAGAARDAGLVAPAGGFSPTVNVYADSMSDVQRIGAVVHDVLSDMARGSRSFAYGS